jgi:DNA-directed RNA polymerase alpha subunit
VTDFTERDKRILEMKQQGYTLAAIGREFDISIKRVSQIVIREGKLQQAQGKLSKVQLKIKEQSEKIQRIKDEYEVRRKALDDWYQSEMDAILNRNEHGNIPIESLNLSARANKIMRREGVDTVGDVLQVLRFNPGGTFGWYGFADHHFAELKAKLKEAGFAIPDPESKD